MKKQLLMCAMLCGMPVPGCVFVVASGNPCERVREEVEELELREQELAEWEHDLDQWEHDLDEREQDLNERK